MFWSKISNTVVVLILYALDSAIVFTTHNVVLTVKSVGSGSYNFIKTVGFSKLESSNKTLLAMIN